MAYEVFTRKIVRTTTPAISISTLGKIALNQTATDILRKNHVEHVLLLWDGENRKIALQPADKTDTRAYHVAFGTKSGSGFSAKTFCDHIKYDTAVIRSFAAEWNPKDKMLEISLRESKTQPTQVQQRGRGRPRKEVTS